ncbi:MAG: hypothetical protein JNN12_07825 [Bacteroidetes Order II. Incertae sedis bacterium]|nr:hypothetical protein [Bacteroidetes Order II. bacterium]
MDILSQYTIPYLHPLAVHFPLVLLLLCVPTSAMWLLTKREMWQQGTFYLSVLALVSSVFAKKTGEALAEGVEGEPMVEQILGAHAAAADFVIVANLVLVFLLILVWYADRNAKWGFVQKTPFRMAVLLVAVFAAGLVAYVAHLGGLMTWGVPVTP